jgi:regulatory protein
MDREALEKAIEAEREELRKAALSLALRRINAREYSSAELEKYLLRKKVSRETAHLVVEELVGKGWIDDSRYTKIMARSLVQREKGPRQIVMKLKTKGVSISLREAQALFEEISRGDEEPSEQSRELRMIEDVLRRRYPGLLGLKGRDLYRSPDYRRAFQGLIRRGFSPDLIKKCIQAPVEADDVETEGDS